MPLSLGLIWIVLQNVLHGHKHSRSSFYWMAQVGTRLNKLRYVQAEMSVQFFPLEWPSRWL